MTLDPIEQLGTLGTQLGGLAWVQGPGGNVSVKTDDDGLWVKASGTRLRDVGSASGHVRVPLSLAQRALEGDAEADTALFAHRPRPSLETYFHALDGRVVAHTHALGVLLAACSNVPLDDSPIDGAPVVVVPYMRPGRDVALAMQRLAPQPADTRVFVLLSHGVVVIAPTVERAIAVSTHFDNRCRATVTATRASIDAYLAQALAHGATLAIPGGVARAVPDRAIPDEPQYLFPDAVVYTSVARVDDLRDVARPATEVLSRFGRSTLVADDHARRVLVARTEDSLMQAMEVLVAHDWVEDALRPLGRASYLPSDEPARILDLPSEKYRMNTHGQRSP